MEFKLYGGKFLHMSHYQNFEQPFEIPASWEWVTIKDIGEIVTGNTPSKEVNEFYGGDVPFYKPTDLSQGIDTQSASDTLTQRGFEQSRQLPVNSILITCIGATIGKIGLIKKAGSCNQQINAIIPNNSVVPEYIFYVCSSSYFQNCIKENASSTTLPILNKKSFSSLLFPLPPISEQRAIIASIKDYLEILSNVEIYKIKIKSAILACKSKILELAMQGKLVPQDPTDEPAAEMLNRINPNTKIITDNPHYPQLPDNWALVKLADLAKLLSGRDLNSEYCNKNCDGIPYLIGASNIDHGNLKFVRWTKNPQVISIYNDVLLSCKGTIGEIVLNRYGDIHIARQFMAIRCRDCISPHYLITVLHANLAIIRKRANGIIPGISRPALLDLIIPVPPLAEQNRIFNMLLMITSELDLIEDCLH